jgi:hypothetical protein
VTAITLAATVWSAKPIYGPLRREFGWSEEAIYAAGVISVMLTAAALPHALRIGIRHGARTVATAGCLACGVIALVLVPNLTHFWQLAAILSVLGIVRAWVLAGGWLPLLQALGRRGAVIAEAASAVVSAALLTPWIAEAVYRNSWREGVAACAGLLLVLAAPIAYVLLPGRAQVARERSP